MSESGEGQSIGLAPGQTRIEGPSTIVRESGGPDAIFVKPTEDNPGDRQRALNELQQAQNDAAADRAATRAREQRARAAADEAWKAEQPTRSPFVRYGIEGKLNDALAFFGFQRKFRR